jgi:hypothetical protein
MSATIKRGDIVRIKPEWQDPGDGRFIWRALEDEDGGRVKICATNTGLTFPPNQIVNVSMLEMAQENARLLAQHTPGPWNIDSDAEGCGSFAIWDSLARKIGSTRPLADYDKRPGSPMLAEVNEANARLIAAAPELLDAVTEFVRLGKAGADTSWHSQDVQPVIYSMLTAIAKATGGAQ